MPVENMRKNCSFNWSSKTYDVLSLVKAIGYTYMNVYAIPFHYPKSQIFPMLSEGEIWHIGEWSKMEQSLQVMSKQERLEKL